MCATVVDLLDRKEEGATLLGEAESMCDGTRGRDIHFRLPRRTGRAAIMVDSSLSIAAAAIFGMGSARHLKPFVPVQGYERCRVRGSQPLMINMFFNRARCI
jgi:hypothetical protein